MSKWTEVLEDESERISSKRVTLVFGVFVLAVVLLILTFKDTSQVVALATIFASLIGGVSSVGIMSDNSVKKASMNPDPTPVIARPNVPAMVINNAPQGNQ